MLVGDGDGLVQVPRQDQGPAAAQRRGDDLAPLHGRQQPVDAGGDPVEEGRVPGHQDGLGVLVVLGLGEEVHGDPVRIGAAVAQDQDLGGAGHHVDADLTEDRPLGGGDIDVAGADDLVHAGDRVGPIGQGGDGLGPADGEDAVHPGDRGGGQHQVVALPLGVGTTMISSATPATLAGMAFIRTEDG